MVTVADVWPDVNLVFGTCDDEFKFRRLNDAIELLANKGEWQPALVYLDVQTDGNRTITLPSEIETPLAVLVGGKPALGHDRLFEFHLNGPGQDWSECQWKWRDGGQYPVMIDPDGTKGLLAVSESVEDVGDVVRIYGLSATGSQLRTEVSPGVFEDGIELPIQATPVSYSTETPSRIFRISKPATAGRVKILDEDGAILSDLQPFETSPMYRRITINRDADTVRIFARRTTYKVARQTDIIPLPQRYALVLALRALRAYDDQMLDTALGFEAQAARMTAEKHFRLQPPVSMPVQVNIAGSLSSHGDDIFDD